jgi:phosphatidylglycerol:prolipoprotein diacylglycerol transferase
MLNDVFQNLDPIIVSIGPFVLRWYGLAYALGFLCFALVAYRLAKR